MTKYKCRLLVTFLTAAVLLFCENFSQNRTYRYPDAVLPESCSQNQSVTVTASTTVQLIPSPRAVSSTNYTTGTATLTKASKTVTGTGTLWLTGTNRPSVGSIIQNTSQDADTLINWYYITAIASETSLTIDRNYTETTVSEKAYIAATPARVCTYIMDAPSANTVAVLFKGIDGANIGTYPSNTTNGDVVNIGYTATRTAPINGVMVWTAAATASITITFKGRDYATP